MKNIKKYLTLLFLFFLFSEAFAYRLKDDDVIVVGGVITSCIYDISTKGNVIEIPEILDGQTIIGIGDYAFSVAGKIAELILPSTLKTIGNGVFDGHALTSIVIPSGVTSIGYRAFYGNALSSINLPAGLESIADETFANNQLTSITLPDGLKTIGNSAFTNNKITSLTIPNSVQSVGGWAFSNNRISVLNFQQGCQLKEIPRYCFSNNDIKNLTIPNSVLIISDGAFESNIKLTNVVFGTNLLKIKRGAFGSCNLATVSFPGSLVFIGRYAFANNSNLISFNLPVSAKNYQWIDTNGDKHNAGKKVTNLYYSYVAIIPYTLKDEDVETTNGVITYCSYFDDITNVASIITIPDKLDGQDIVAIGSSGFQDRGISEILLPAGVRDINNWAFAYNEIIKITLPKNLETIGDYAFYNNCLNSVSFEATSHLEIIGMYAFSSNMLLNIDFPESVKKIEKYAFAYNSLQNINFEENSRLISIGSYAFMGNVLLKFTLPDPKVNSYDHWVDWDGNTYSNNLVATNLESFYKIPIELTLTDNDVEVINGVIVSCTLSNLYANILTIPKTLDGQEIIGIAQGVFQRMGLIGVNLPSTLKTIEYSAFSENEIIQIKIPASVEEIKGQAFYMNNINDLVFEDKSRLRNIGWGAFYVNKITSLVLPDSLNYIENYAFSNNRISNGIIIPDSIEYIGWGAFSNNQIPQVFFGKNSILSSLGEYAFAGNMISNEIFIPKTLTEISDYAFSDNKISKVIVHDGIVEYGNGAFLNNNPSLKIVLHKPPTIPLVTHFFWWKDNNDNHFLPGDIIPDFNNRYKAVIDQFFVVKFIVKDNNNEPVENASIQFYNSTLITDLNGIDSIGPVFRGLQNYIVSASGCYGLTGNVDVQDNMTVLVTLVRYYNVNITVVDVNNNPIPGAGIAIIDTTLTSGANGKTSIKLPNGDYPFVVNAKGYKELDSSLIVIDSDNSIIVKLLHVMVNYLPNGGTGASYAETTDNVVYETNNNTFTRIAYTFSHWNSEADNSGITYTEKESISLGYTDIDLYAIWDPVDYNIIYHLDGGINAIGNPAKYNTESEINLLPATKPTLYFATWLDADSNRVNKIEKGRTGDIELWAVFTAEPTYYIDYHNLENASHNNQSIYTKFDLPMSFTDANKRGYAFAGWYEDALLSKKITTIPDGSKKDYDIYAKWGGAIEYAITYNLDGGINNLTNPVKYTIESNKIIFESPSKTGGAFVSWFSDKELTRKITEIPQGSSGDTTIYAKWILDIFDIQYVLNGGNNHPANPENYTIESSQINFESPSKTGAAFVAWHSDKELTKKIIGIPTGSLGDTIIYASWELNGFEIHYILNGGTNHPENPSYFTIESEQIIFESPSKKGGAFVGWYTDKELTKKITEIPHGSISDTTIYAKWILDIFDIQYVLNGGNNHPENPENYTIESSQINFESASKTGAAFVAWYSDKELTKKIIGIPTGSLGDTTIYARWELNGFEIHYILNGGTNHPENPSYFTIESEQIIFESPSKKGGAFVAWYTDKELTKKITEIPHGSIGDTTIYAKWELDIFDIQYVLNGGNNHPVNPVKYTVESNQINFESPSKTGASFVAWCSDKELTKKITDIPTGSIGDTIIYAKWELDNFDIQYILDGGVNSPANPAKYTIESDKIIFESPAKTGAKFIAWYNDKNLITEITEIPNGSLGDTLIYAKWELDTFDIQYVLNGGNNNLTNPIKYTIESDKIIFVPPAKTGAKFIAWFGDKELIKEIKDIPKGSFGDTTIYAKWELDSFDIQYVLDGGDNNPANPAKYTIESDKIVFEQPAKIGAKFIAWYEDKDLITEITEIPKGSLGDTIVYAKWELETFNIQYVLDGGNNSPANPAKYTIESNTIILENPDKSKFIFDGWFTNSNFTESINSIPKGSLGNKTVYARWLEIFKVNFIITTDSINPARDIDIVIDDNQNLHSDILGLADTLMADGSSLVYSIEINGIVINGGFVTISGSDVTIKVEIVDCYIRWYDVLFCDNGKGLWTDFAWYKDDVRVSEEQFFHNPGGIESGKYKLSATSVAGVEYIWEKDFKEIKFGNQDNNTTKFELNVFPVPISRNKNLNISLSENINLQTCKIFIYGFNGTLIKTINNPLYMNEINIDSKFSSGLYHVILNDDKNKLRDVKAFVVN